MSSRIKVWALVVGTTAAVGLMDLLGIVRAEDEVRRSLDADAINEFLLQRFDENFNEKLYRSEIVTARRRLADILESGFDPSPIAVTDWQNGMRPLFEELDCDGNKVLDAEEIVSARRVLGRLLKMAEKDEEVQADHPRPERARRRPRSSRRPSASGRFGIPSFGGGFPFNPLSFLGSGIGAGGLGTFGGDAGLGGELGLADWGWSTSSAFEEGAESVDFGQDGDDTARLDTGMMTGRGGGRSVPPMEMEDLNDLMGMVDEVEPDMDSEPPDEMGELAGPPEEFLGDELAETMDPEKEGAGQIPMGEGEGPEAEAGDGGKTQVPKPPRPDF